MRCLKRTRPSTGHSTQRNRCVFSSIIGGMVSCGPYNQAGVSKAHAAEVTPLYSNRLVKTVSSATFHQSNVRSSVQRGSSKVSFFSTPELANIGLQLDIDYLYYSQIIYILREYPRSPMDMRIPGRLQGSNCLIETFRKKKLACSHHLDTEDVDADLNTWTRKTT